MPSELTPMMQQYVRMKELHPDCILFFRLGDFYEMFNEDARLVSKELELTLTTRDRGKPADERTPMCGVPYHSADAYIARLISKGYKVAICEQMEDPSTAKGLVDRDIIRIVTPGTVISESMLEEGRNNFICSVYRAGEDVGLCFCDISTGEVWATSFAGALSGEHLYNELGRFSPREAVLSEEAYADAALLDFLVSRLECRCENGGADRYDGAAWRDNLRPDWRTCPVSLGVPPWPPAGFSPTCTRRRRPISPTSLSSNTTPPASTWSWISPPGRPWSLPRPCAPRKRKAPCCGCWTGRRLPWAAASSAPGWSVPF